MDDKRQAQFPTREELDRIVARIAALPDSFLADIASCLWEPVTDLEGLDVAVLLEREGAEACRYGLHELSDSFERLINAYERLARELVPRLQRGQGAVGTPPDRLP